MLIYGSRARHGGSFKLKEIPCAHCEQTHTQTMSVFTRYGYLYWIPFIPMSKVTVMECDHCKRTIGEEEYDGTLRAISEEVGSRVGNPKWYWSGMGIVAALIFFSGIAGALHEDDPRLPLLEADIAEMTNTPDLQTDSLAYHIDQFLTAVMVEELAPEDAYYKTKSYGNNLLVLASIVDLQDLVGSEQEVLVSTLEEVISGLIDLEGRNLYVGAMNHNNSIQVTRTPQETKTLVGSKNDLLDFYGEVIE